MFQYQYEESKEFFNVQFIITMLFSPSIYSLFFIPKDFKIQKYPTNFNFKESL